MKIYYSLSETITLVNDNASLLQVPPIGIIIKTGGKKYKIAEVIYDLDKNEIDIRSSEYIEGIKKEIQKRQSNF